MSDFYLYFTLGRTHISDLDAYDHILFIASFCMLYTIKNWKTLLWLVTAFTIGHSLTLALSVYKIITIPSEIIEFCIPITILVNALLNLKIVFKKQAENDNFTTKYLLTLFFGLIHGMGFSNYLKSFLGEDENIVLPLFAFNLGLELGQIIIAAIFTCITSIVLLQFNLPKKTWVLLTSISIIAITIPIIIQSKIW